MGREKRIDIVYINTVLFPIFFLVYGNNFKPAFTTDLYDFTVDPAAESNTPVGTVSATDGDAVSYGNISYSIGGITGSTVQYFKVGRYDIFRLKKRRKNIDRLLF